MARDKSADEEIQTLIRLGMAARDKNPSEEKFEALILLELAALHVKVDRLLERLPDVNAEDHALAEKLFPALAGALGSERFSASEALDEPAVRAVAGHLTLIKFGQLMGRLENMTIGHYRIYRHAVGRKVTLWQLMRVVE